MDTNQAQAKRSPALLWLWGAVGVLALIAGGLTFIKPAAPAFPGPDPVPQASPLTVSTPQGEPATPSSPAVSPSGTDPMTNGDPSQQDTTPHRLKDGLTGGQRQ